MDRTPHNSFQKITGGEYIMPRLSVILPAYNAGRTLDLAVRSILNQTYGDFELILLDDGSRDNTADVIKEFTDPRLRIIQDGINKGLTARLNQGVNLAHGDLIARMDADDVAFPTRFEKQIRFLEAHNDIDVVGTRAIAFHDDTKKIIGLMPFRPDHYRLTHRVWASIPLPHPTWMGRTAWFRAHPYNDVARAEDQDLLLRALPYSRYACLSETLLGYRVGPFQLQKTLTARRSLLAARLRTFSEREQYLNMMLACCLTGFKTFLDIAAAIPGCDVLYFSRMWQMDISDSVRNELTQLLKP
jgi:glycosyltransferase involved in cell wall biosynthesis